MASKRYIVTATGSKKTTGEVYSKINCIIKTKTGAFVSDRDVQFIDYLKPIGTIVEVETLVVESE
jgi:hypothetical protein